VTRTSKFQADNHGALYRPAPALCRTLQKIFLYVRSKLWVFTVQRINLPFTIPYSDLTALLVTVIPVIPTV